MNVGRIDFTRVGSDEVIGSYPYSNGLRTLALVRLKRAKNNEVIADTNAFGTYIAFTAAELAGVPGVSLPDAKDVTPESLAMLESACVLVAPEADEAGDSTEVEENPTGTSRASS